MIIKSHIRGGYRSAAAYLRTQGKNEKIRTVEISNTDARDLDGAFHHMWVLADGSKAKKPLHHISINPYKDERLTDEQVLKIVARCEEKYGYKPHDHQRVIVEHIRDGRQHFHVIWNRVSLTTGRAVWPGLHWNKSKQAAREMEKELGLKRPTPKRAKRIRGYRVLTGVSKYFSQSNNHCCIRGAKTLRKPRKATTKARRSPAPTKLKPNTRKWPEAAILDWELWGHLNPPRFFAKWPELAPDGFNPMAMPPLH